MKKILFLLLSPLSLLSQTYEKTITIDPVNGQTVTASCNRANGNILVSINQTNAEGFVFAELTPVGDTVWTKKWNYTDFSIGTRGTKVFAIKERPDGNIVVAGLTRAGTDHAWLGLYSSNGSTQLGIHTFKQNYSCSISSIDVGSDNSVYFCGGDYYFYSGGSASYAFYDPFVGKMSASFLPEWHYSPGDHNTTTKKSGMFNKVMMGADGNILVTGTVESGKLIVCKLDPTGAVLWRKEQITPSTGGRLNFTVTPNNYIYVSSSAVNKIDPSSGEDIVIHKMKPNGDSVWTKVYGTSGNHDDFIWDLNHDGNGNIVCAAFVFQITGFQSRTAFFKIDTNGTSPSCFFYNSLPNIYPDRVTMNKTSYNKFTIAVQDRLFQTEMDGSTTCSTTALTVASINYFSNMGTGTYVDPYSPGIPTMGIYNSNLNYSAVNTCYFCTVPPAASTIAGATAVCSGTTNTYSVAAVSGATSYTWTLPGGWTGTSTTNSITTTSSSTSGNITVTTNNACGSSTVQTTTVTVNAIPASPGTISGTASMCVGSGAETYTIAAVAGATTYTWSLPSGWSGTSTSNSITATPGTTGGNINVTANNTCGNSTPQTLSVVVNPLPTVTYIQSPSTVCLNHSAVSLGASTPTGGVYSGTAVTGSTFNATTAGLGIHSITYTFTDGNGCVNAASSNITVDACTGVESGALSQETGLYPNPTSGIITITDIEAGSEIEIFNMIGEKVLCYKSENATMDLNLSTLENGTYIIKVISENRTITKRIIKQ